MYDIPKVDNNWFTIIHMYYKEKYGIIEPMDNIRLYKANLLGIVEMQTGDILILVDNVFASNKKAIKIIKIIIKDSIYLTSI